MSNVADSDVPLFRQCSLLPCLSANGPTARIVGIMLQAVNLPDLHNVTRVPFFSSGFVSASIPSSLAPFASYRSGVASSVFSQADCYWYTVGGKGGKGGRHAQQTEVWVWPLSS